MTQPNDPRLPWRPRGNGSGCIIDADGKLVACVFIELGTDSAIADRVALIVRAVNDFSALVKAAKIARDGLDIMLADRIEKDPAFLTSKSGRPWEAMVALTDAIHLAEDQHEPG